MLSSKRWDDLWVALRTRGIDGFKVGVPQGEHPGPIFFDLICDRCSNIIEPKSNCSIERQKRECANCMYNWNRVLSVYDSMARFDVSKLPKWLITSQ